MAHDKEKVDKIFSTKKCYECFEHLALDAVECPSCKSRVGPVDRNGIAKKPVDWISYVIFVVAFAALVLFVWKVLLK